MQMRAIFDVANITKKCLVYIKTDFLNEVCMAPINYLLCSF